MVDFHTEKFSGPLDLLLALIQKNEVSIYDIPISEITDQFLEYINSQSNVLLGDLSEFYKMAADLIWIKSQMLLPKDVEFDEDYIDPRDELVQRLLEYSKYRKYSELLDQQGNDSEFVPLRKESEMFLPFTDEELLEDNDITDIFNVFLEILKKNTVGEKIFNVYEDVSEKEKISLMNELLEKNECIKFTDLFKNHATPSHIICSFFAVLECVKDKIILISQNKAFDDIDIQKRPGDYNPALADDYDEEYDEIVENNLQDSDSFSVMETDD